MSITQGMTSGGSWSGRRTMRAFPQKGRWYTSLGRGNMQLLPGVSNTELLVLLAALPMGGPALGVARGVAIRGISLVTKPSFWAGVNVYHESEDIAAYLRGEDMSWQLGIKWRPIYGPHPMFGPVFLPIPFPYLDFTKSPSSGVGGPGEIPNLHRPPLSMKETGSPRPSSSKKGRKYRKHQPKCKWPLVWDGEKCVKWADLRYRYKKG
jgi:hypothetical protein